MTLLADRLIPEQPSDADAAEVLGTLIPQIRRDERERCLRELRRLPLGSGALTSTAYRAGFCDALDAVERCLEHLPIEVSVPAAWRDG
jgi:hypothetical protein